MKKSTTILISGLIAGPIVLTAAWIILGFLSTGYDMWDIHIDSYSAISQPISGLGLGNTAIYMNGAFILTGILIILGSIGFSRALTGTAARRKNRVAAFLSLAGMGAIMDGIFPLTSFMLHTLGFLLALSPILSFPYLGYTFRKDPRWRTVGNIMISAGPLLLVSAIAYFATFKPMEAGLNIGYAGLTERILLVILMGYYATLGIFALGSKDWDPSSKSR